MANDRPDPAEFMEMAQRMLRQLFGEQRNDDEPWAEATRRPFAAGERSKGTAGRGSEPSPARQRENLTFALATRAVEALEDLALNVAAIRQRLERTDSPTPEAPAGTDGGGREADDPPAE